MAKVWSKKSLIEKMANFNFLPTRNSSHSVFSRGHATLHLAVSVGTKVTYLNYKRFLHYCPCQTVRDCLAVYTALLLFHRRNRPCLGVSSKSSRASDATATSSKNQKRLSLFLDFFQVAPGLAFWSFSSVDRFSVSRFLIGSMETTRVLITWWRELVIKWS